MSTASKRKYLLYSATGGDAETKSCAFFLSDQGCKNGDSCKFKHEKPYSSSGDVGIRSGSSNNTSINIASSTVNSSENTNKMNNRERDREDNIKSSNVKISKTEAKDSSHDNYNKIRATPSQHNQTENRFYYADELEKQKNELQKEYENKL